jgi:hypothetical protein
MRVTGVEVATGHNKILLEIGGQTENTGVHSFSVGETN